MPHRKLAASAAALLGLAVIAGPAAAQTSSGTTIEVTKVQVSPNKAGTKKKPRAVKKLTVGARVNVAEGQKRPVINRIKVLFPKGSVWNGAKYPKCSLSQLSSSADFPTSKCGKAVFGKGKANALADTDPTVASIRVVNGGAKNIYFYTSLDNPAVVRAPAPGKLTKKSGKWAYELDVTIPDELQIVGGVPIAVTDLAVTAGKGSILATSSCPKDKKWPFEVTAYLEDQDTGAPLGTTKTSDTTPCK
ncbi:hypothetical protein [Patulibacter defluvii]|uniref:hypothetical protein n=1 Tax=Patulibacter defluvii TaxID=3095358 RepID=UPI002A751C73|nr:hypothetical protein [Patulibacter sp. DM4]